VPLPPQDFCSFKGTAFLMAPSKAGAKFEIRREGTIHHASTFEPGRPLDIAGGFLLLACLAVAHGFSCRR
jgi:hypothetical protein